MLWNSFTQQRQDNLRHSMRATAIGSFDRAARKKVWYQRENGNQVAQMAVCRAHALNQHTQYGFCAHANRRNHKLLVEGEASIGYLQLCDISGPIPAMEEILREARSGRLSRPKKLSGACMEPKQFSRFQSVTGISLTL
jgi:hypothetical protein